MKIKKILFLVLIGTLVYLVYLNFFPKAEYKMTVKQVKYKTLSQNSFSCESIANASIYPNYEKTDEENIYLDSSLSKGTDKIAVEIKNNKAYFLTRAAMEVGIATPEEDWEIFGNDEKQLYIVYIDKRGDGDSTLDQFVLDKTSGIGLWTRTRTKGLLQNGPEGFINYFKCY